MADANTIVNLLFSDRVGNNSPRASIADYIYAVGIIHGPGQGWVCRKRLVHRDSKPMGIVSRQDRFGRGFADFVPQG